MYLCLIESKERLLTQFKMTAIKIENLYKEYQLGTFSHRTLYRDLQTFSAKILGKDDPNSILNSQDVKISKEKILALNNINFEIEKGEIVGLIGRNGAGKSTLLKVISKITYPTKGRILLNGKVGSLLEVGTGFHSELTGRENIYLTGSIYGMSKNEIDQKVDLISDFAGIKSYLETPVKRYSTGMTVRLGFAVAAHLDPEIFIVDEVLAVGDASFRKKATDKMSSLKNNKNQTIIFVSHNLEIIQSLCNRCILLKDGEIEKDGPTEEVIDYYKKSFNEIVSTQKGNYEWAETKNNNLLNVISMKLKSAHDSKISSGKFQIDQDIFLEVNYQILEEVSTCCSIEIYTSSNQLALVAMDDTIENEWQSRPKKKGFYKTQFVFPKNLFNEGVYNITLNIFNPPSPANQSILFKQMNILSFEIQDNFEKGGTRGSYPYYWGSPTLRPKIKSETLKSS